MRAGLFKREEKIIKIICNELCLKYFISRYGTLTISNSLKSIKYPILSFYFNKCSKGYIKNLIQQDLTD